MSKIDGIWTFYSNYTKLSQITRTGWVMRNVPVKQLETDSDHTLQVVMLAATFVKELNLLEIDMDRLLYMCFLHDLAEVKTGDISEIYIKTKEDQQNKHEEETRRFIELISSLTPETQAYYLSIWNEFEEGKTSTAILVRQVDKIDGIMKAKLYAKETNRPELFEEFYHFQEEKGTFLTGPLKDIFVELGK